MESNKSIIIQAVIVIILIAPMSFLNTAAHEFGHYFAGCLFGFDGIIELNGLSGLYTFTGENNYLILFSGGFMAMLLFIPLLASKYSLLKMLAIPFIVVDFSAAVLEAIYPSVYAWDSWQTYAAIIGGIVTVVWFLWKFNSHFSTEIKIWEGSCEKVY